MVTTSTGITQEANANSAPLAPLPFDTLDWGEELLCKTYSMQRSVNDIFWAGIAQWVMLCISSIKHDLARQNFEKKTVLANASPVFFFKILPPSSPILSQNWKHELATLCFILKRISPKKIFPHKFSPKKIFSIKHDLARSCFQFWPKIGDEGGKILKKKTDEALAETVFFSKFCHLRSRFWGP